ncbi:MAG: alkaline phosphatase D family protein, partial [Verrucomicrobiae bacterium]|nr:alkaline phosphatase D family protein [Verrucomicrobiae bacterium]
FTSNWHRTHDRIWLGESFWANPMEDWQVVDGGAEVCTGGGDRNIQLITHQLEKTNGSFEMSCRVKRVEPGKQDGGAGFRIGIQSDINEYRSNCFEKGGLTAGVIDGQLILGKTEKPITMDPSAGYRLQLSGKPTGSNCRLTLSAYDLSGSNLGSVSANVSSRTLLGNIALVSNFNPRLKNDEGARYRFEDWSVSGDAFAVRPERKFGPILWSMYSLSDSRSKEGFVLKLSALTGPLGARHNKTVELQIGSGGNWKNVATAELDADAWSAIFRIPNWNEKRETPFQLVYRENHSDGTETTHVRQGIIKANPEGRPLRLGALTCQKDYSFPYEPVAKNLVKLDPDVLYFSGDQLYEGHGGYGLIREPAPMAILNYLRKFYMFGWAFGEAMLNRPTLCIPDDHDVFHGNIWGEGGAPMLNKEGGTSSKGGYIEPARMVNVVHRTNAGHHPDYFDPKPVKQGISVYYGDMVYGNVSFAILGDRQFKTGPEKVNTGSGRADHVPDPDFDTSTLDKPGLVLLGDRQEKFLKHWAKDWRGHSMKVLLSQTVFAGMATHHGNYDGYLKEDLDSGGWPQTARNRAIDILREAMPLHVNGDQHLTSLVQYGVKGQRDSNWSFCVPAISAGYPRWWRPDELGMPHKNRPRHGLADTGEMNDGLGNKVYVYAVGNPEVGTEKNRYKLAHQKGSGFGIVTIDTRAKTYYLECFRYLIDATDGKTGNQFPGWPVTIHQKENRGENRLS